MWSRWRVSLAERVTYLLRLTGPTFWNVGHSLRELRPPLWRRWLARVAHFPFGVGHWHQLAERVAYVQKPSARNISMLASNAVSVWSITASVWSQLVMPAKPHQSTPFKSIAWRIA